MRRALAVRTLDRTGLGAALRRWGRWQGVLVLNYHRVGDWSDERWDRELWSASAEQLDEQLRTLSRETEVIHADAIPAAIGGPRGRRVAITFDDGYRDNHDVALPLLRSHGLVATFFVATGFIDRPRIPWWDEIAWLVRTSERAGMDAQARAAEVSRLVEAVKLLPAGELEPYVDGLARAAGRPRCADETWARRWMTWEMVRALRGAGMGVGGHTVDHPVLSRLSIEAQRAEVEGCARRLASELGEPMRLFSYPVGTPGSFDARTAAVVREAGVELAFAYDGGVAGRRGFDPLAIPRASVSATMDGAEFRALVTAPRAFARW